MARVLVAAAVLAALAVLLLGRDGVPRATEPTDRGVQDSAPPPPTLARAALPPSVGPTGVVPSAGAGEVEVPAASPVLPWVVLEDDPALPKERRRLDVEVVDARGDVVPGAWVQAVWGEWRTKAYPADARGRATLAVPRGTRALEVVGVPASDERPLLLVHYHGLLGGEKETRVEIRLGSRITGTLVDGEGAPIAGARVHAEPTPFGFGPATTDERGEFRLDVLHGSEADVIFHGYVRDRPWPHPSRARAKRIRAGTQGLRLVATPVSFDSVLRLRVVQPNGAPAVGATVWYTAGGGTHGHPQTVEADGRAVLTAQQDGWTSVSVEWPTGRRESFDDLATGGAEVELRLSPTSELRGLVVDAAGKPVANAWCAALSGSTCLAAFGTDGEGRFETTLPVAAGTKFQLTARFPTDENAATSRGVVHGVVAGWERPTVVLEEVGPLLAPARREFAVSVRVGFADTVLRGFEMRNTDGK